MAEEDLNTQGQPQGGEEQGATPPAREPESSSGDDPMEQDELRALLGHDPFEEQGSSGPDAERGTEGEGQQTGEGGEESGDPQRGEGSGEATEPSEGGQQQPNKEVEELRAQIDRQNAQIEQQNARLEQLLQQGQQGQQEQGQQGQRGPDVPSYAFQIPDEIANAVASDDASERKQGLSALVQGLGQSIHLTMRQEMEQRLGQLEERVPQEIQSHTSRRDQAQHIKQDYYGTFEEHDNDAVKPIVQQATREVLQDPRFQRQGWSPEVRDAIGARVNEKLASLGVQIQGQGPGAPPRRNGQNGQQRPAEPNNMMGATARPGEPSGNTEEAEIERTLFGP